MCACLSVTKGERKAGYEVNLERPPFKAYVNIYGLSQAAGVITEAVLYRGSQMENAEHMSMSGLLAGEHFLTTLHGISRALPLQTNVLRLI